MSGVWQVISDCANCRTTGSVVEVLDAHHPACHLGVPVSTECQMCDHAVRARQPDFPARDPLRSRRCPACRTPLSEQSRVDHVCGSCKYAPEVDATSGVNVREPAVAMAALERWAEREGMTASELCESSLGGSLEAVSARYARGELVESSFDAIAFLFPSMAAGGGVGVMADATAEVPIAVREVVEVDARAAVKLLISVMVADGELRAGERAFVDRFVEGEGFEPVQPHELRPWRPHEVGPIASPALAERALEAAVELMHLDGERDGSEFRIVRTFARAWGVPELTLDGWNRTYDRRYTPRLSRIWRGMSRWVSTN